jgi:hypothetical protein
MPSFKRHIVPLSRALAGVALAACLLLNTGCATLANVRSATVDQGSSFRTQVSVSKHPGPVAGWFWSFDCDNLCPGETPPGMDVSYTHGWGPSVDRLPISLSVGVASFLPYVDGYVQLSESKTHPSGIGARVSASGSRWVQTNVYGRADLPVGDNFRLMWNPGIVALSASSPDGIGKGSFFGMTQGVGLQMGAGSVLFTPSVAGVLGVANRTNYSRTLGPETNLIWTAGVAIEFRRDPRNRKR